MIIPSRQIRALVLKAVLMALWQRRAHYEPVVPRSDSGTQFTATITDGFLYGHNFTGGIGAAAHCHDNAAAERFFGMLKQERVNRRCYQTLAEPRTDIIERCRNPRIRQRVAAEARKYPLTFFELSAETGWTLWSQEREDARYDQMKLGI